MFNFTYRICKIYWKWDQGTIVYSTYKLAEESCSYRSNFKNSHFNNFYLFANNSQKASLDFNRHIFGQIPQTNNVKAANNFNPKNKKDKINNEAVSKR